MDKFFLSRDYVTCPCSWSAKCPVNLPRFIVVVVVVVLVVVVVVVVVFVVVIKAVESC